VARLNTFPVGRNSFPSTSPHVPRFVFASHTFFHTSLLPPAAAMSLTSHRRWNDLLSQHLQLNVIPSHSLIQYDFGPVKSTDNPSLQEKSQWGKCEFFTFCVLPHSLLFQSCSFCLTGFFFSFCSAHKYRSAYRLTVCMNVICVASGG